MRVHDHERRSVAHHGILHVAAEEQGVDPRCAGTIQTTS